MAEQKTKVVIMIPTYNEAGNIEALVREIMSLPLGHDLSVLVVDDDSPDGTGEIVARLAAEDARIRLLTRKEKRGRGLAGIEGFKQSLSLRADYIIEMDGDGSHQPRFIPALLEQARTSDLVIGSRYVQGGKDSDRPFYRRFITFLARNYIRRRFGLRVRDISSGFRCFRRAVLEKIGLDGLISVGPSVVLEILDRAHRLNFRITEVPIFFLERKAGQTKLTARTLLQTFFMTFKFRRA